LQSGETGYRDPVKERVMLFLKKVKFPVISNQTMVNIRKRRDADSDKSTFGSTPATPATPATDATTEVTGTTDVTGTTEVTGTTSLPECPWGDWHSWSKCDCRTGVQARIRNPKVVPYKHCTIHGCAGQNRACTRSKCAIDCVYSKWSSWSVCHGPCGGGVRRRHRGVRVPALYGGKRCKRFVEEDHCRVHDARCNTDCEVGHWSDWSPCHHTNPYETCGECSGYSRGVDTIGFQLRERIIVGHRGNNCPELKETQQCHISCC